MWHSCGARIQPGQCLLCRQMGHLARDCPSVRQLRGDDRRRRCIFAGSHDDSTTGSRARLRLHHVLRACCSLAVSLDHLGATAPPLVSSARAIKGKTRLFCWDADGTRASPTSLSNTATNTTDSADHREQYEVNQDLSLLTSMQHLESFDEGCRSAKVASFRQCTQCPSPSVGVFAEWAAFAVEDVKGYALLDTGGSRSVGGYMPETRRHHGWSKQIPQ